MAKSDRKKIMEMRVQGYSFMEIAAKLDLKQHVCKMEFTSAMQELEKNAVESLWEQRQLDLARCDAIIKANMLNLSSTYTDEDENGEEIEVVSPNHRAADTLLKTMNHRAKLLGLYADETGDMTTLKVKVNALLKKDVDEMSDDELDQFFQDHWKQEQENK